MLNFLILLLLSRSHEMGGYDVETDFYGSYAIAAKHILEGKSYEDPYHGPGYPCVLALGSLLFHDMFLTGKIISIISGLLFGIFTYKVIKNIFNSRIAFFTVLILLINILPYPVVVGTDIFFAFLVTLSIYFIFKNRQPSNLNIILGGLVAGYAYLTRYDAIFLILSVAFSFFIINPKRISWRQGFKSVFIFCSTFFIVALPLLIINYMKYGNPLFNLTYLNMASNFYDIKGVSTAESLNAASVKFDSFLAVLFYDPIRFIIGVIQNAYYGHFQNVVFNVLRFPLYLFTVPGTVLLMKRSNKSQLSYFTIPVFGFLLLSLSIFHERYYLPFLPFLILFSLYFLFYYKENFEKSESSIKKLMSFSNLSYVLVVLFLLPACVRETKKYINSEPTELLEISQLLREKAIPSDIIIARKPHLGYLSHVQSIYFPEVDSLGELLKYAKENKATYLLYSNIEAEMRPQLKILLEPEKVPHNLEIFYQQNNSNIMLYRIL
ncbi:MAG: glycosyltransferase family 39 protein [Candidatus Hodarchaeota archaeon]